MHFHHSVGQTVVITYSGVGKCLSETLNAMATGHSVPIMNMLTLPSVLNPFGMFLLFSHQTLVEKSQPNARMGVSALTLPQGCLSASVQRDTMDHTVKSHLHVLPTPVRIMGSVLVQEVVDLPATVQKDIQELGVKYLFQQQ